jgi:ribosomal protein L14E/L6E/L27E
MGMSCDNDESFPLGSLVVVRRGRHAGSVFVVVGIEKEQGKDGRILIADGRKISAARPKRKNSRHVEPAGIVSGQVVQRLAGGKFIDDGWLAQVISRLKS